jgi:hypothetical protein
VGVKATSVLHFLTNYISFLGLEDQKPAFRPILPKKSSSFTKNKRTISFESLHSAKAFAKAVPGGKKPSAPLRNKKRVSPPLSNSAGSGGTPLGRASSFSSLGSELGFTNIAGLKSATNSVQSTRSNFEVNSRYVICQLNY